MLNAEGTISILLFFFILGLTVGTGVGEGRWLAAGGVGLGMVLIFMLGFTTAAGILKGERA